jgi:hypothetical protein
MHMPKPKRRKETQGARQKWYKDLMPPKTAKKLLKANESPE